MSEVIPPAAPAPDAGGAPAPVAPVAPEPVAPVAPVEPVAPPAAEPTADEADDNEWEAAQKQLFPGLKSTQKKEPTDEQAKPEEDGKKEPETPENPAGKKPDEKPEQGDGTEKTGEEDGKTEPNTAVRDARNTARELAQQREAVANDVRAKMFAEVPDTLQDADGDPINGIDDVMKLINPRTNETFTEEEAGQWLLSAQQQFNQQKAQIESQIEQVAETNLDIKYQADAINHKYGEFLKANTELRDELWAEYSKTLVTDPQSGVILSAPVSLEWFYEKTLGPQATAQQQSTAQAEADAQAKAAAEAQAKKDAEDKRQKTRSDRSDIYAPPADPNKDPDEDEWAQAEKSVFGNLNNK